MWQRFFFTFLARPFISFFIGVRVTGRRHIPARDPAVIVANHSSHLDTLVILSLFPNHRLPRVRPVAAAEYWYRNRFTAFVADHLVRVLGIPRKPSREGPDPREQMADVLRGGSSIVVFPEGTRGTSEEMSPFKAGIAHVIEAAPDVPVVPMCLVNLGRSFPKGAVVPLPLFCEVRVGEPIFPTGTRREITSQLEAAVRALREG